MQVPSAGQSTQCSVASHHVFVYRPAEGAGYSRAAKLLCCRRLRLAGKRRRQLKIPSALAGVTCNTDTWCRILPAHLGRPRASLAQFPESDFETAFYACGNCHSLRFLASDRWFALPDDESSRFEERSDYCRS